MAGDGLRDYQDEKAAQQHQAAEAENEVGSETAGQSAVAPNVAAAMLSGPMAGVQRRALVQNVGQHFGNRQVQRMLGTVRRSASAGPEGGPLEQDVTQQIQAERSHGQPLEAGIRREAEQSLGHDLSQVRVHTGGSSAELNRQVGAKAFTTGRDIFFGEGETPSNKELLLHEATHTVQQGFSEAPPSSVGGVDTAHEHAAHAASQHAHSGGAGGVQREAATEDEPEPEVAKMHDFSVQRDPAPATEEEAEPEVAKMHDFSIQREAAPAMEEEAEPEVAKMHDFSVQRTEEGEEE